METVLAHFPELTPVQRGQLAALEDLYRIRNGCVNVISRKDIDQLYVRHVLHSLAIARVCRFNAGARILDVGTGGGFPGIPLAILFPGAHFTLADSIGKKVRVAEEVAREAGLQNVRTVHGRVEAIPERFDFAVGRAVTDMKTFAGWVWNKLEPGGGAGTLGNGILCLKGGGLDAELQAAKKPYAVYAVADFFDDPFFETKKVVYIPR